MAKKTTTVRQTKKAVPVVKPDSPEAMSVIADAAERGTLAVGAPDTPVDAVARAQAATIAEHRLATDEATAQQALTERIAAADPVTADAGSPPTTVAKTRPYCATCASVFGTQSRHWSTRRILARHAVRPFTDAAFLAWLKRHAEAEGLTFPKA